VVRQVFCLRFGVEGLGSAEPRDIPRLDQIGIDGRVLAFTLAVSLVTGLIFGLAPALQSSKSDPNESLRRAEEDRQAGSAADAFAICWWFPKLALSLILLIGAAC